MVKDLNITHDTIKVLEEYIGRKISDIPPSNIFTDMSPRARDMKERINKWDLINIKSFSTAKESSIKMEREPAIWENICQWHLGQGFYLKIYEELTWLHSRKTNNPTKKRSKDLNRHFSKKDMQQVQRHMKRCSASLAIIEMQIKTTMRYHVTPVRVAIINKATNKCWRGCGEKGTLVQCWWECRLVQALWKTVCNFLRKVKMELPFDLAISLLELPPKNPETSIQKYLCTPVFIAAQFTIATW